MCGIAAWSGKKVKDFDLSKLGILGIFNEKRGIDSCGMAVDYNIQVGIDATKVFKDFMQTDGFKSPILSPVVIAHTRKSTTGLKNVDNAHPFGFGFNKQINGHNFVGVHNGSLLNEKELATEFGVDIVVTKDDKTTRTKIDSEILLESIYKNSNFNVLSKYRGAAALVFSNSKEKNVIYCYRGESKDYDYTGAKVEEERPLFYWQEHENSLYISSMEESLLAIGAKKDEVKPFDVNIVYKITDGDISKAVKFKIDRSKAFKYEYTSNVKSQDYYDAFGCEWVVDNNTPYKRNLQSSHVRHLPVTTSTNLNKAVNKNVAHNIYKDNDILEQDKVINFWRLRYKRNGHNINGCYCYIPDYGFYKLDDEIKKSSTMLYDLCGIEFNNKNFNIPYGYKIKNKGVIPFLSENIINPEEHMFFFIDGMRMKTVMDYLALYKNYNSTKVYTISQLSMACSHPIMDDKVTCRPFLSQKIYQNGKLATGVFSFLGSNKIYTFEEGNCINIKPNDKYKVLTLNKDDKNDKEDESLFKLASKNILKNELDKSKQDKSLIEEKLKEQDIMVKNIIFSTLFTTYEDLGKGIQSLDKFKNNTLANKTLISINKFIEDIDDIMENDLQIELNEEHTNTNKNKTK
jgi:predicted glutamine amidotransferase